MIYCVVCVLESLQACYDLLCHFGHMCYGLPCSLSVGISTCVMIYHVIWVLESLRVCYDLLCSLGHGISICVMIYSVIWVLESLYVLWYAV